MIRTVSIVISLLGLLGLRDRTIETDHVAGAKAAERYFHGACDAWEAARLKGKDTSQAARKITASYDAFISHILKTKYIPNAAVLVPDQYAFAGSLTATDGSKWSYIVGKGQGGLIMTRWKRQAWTSDGLPPHGLAVLPIEPTDLFEKFNVGTAAWMGGKREVLRVPYTLVSVSGTIDVRRHDAEWQMEPDRGIVTAGWWKPFGKASTSQPQ